MKLIQSVSDIESAAKSCRHIVVLFNGSVDSAYVLRVLSKHRCKVTALVIDLGNEIKRDKLSEIACYFAVNLKIIDGTEAFAEQALVPAIKANAFGAGNCPISSSLSRPLIAKLAVDYANKQDADAIIYAENQTDSCHVHFNKAISHLGYEGYFGCARETAELSFKQKAVELAKIGLSISREQSTAGSNNLWCRKYELESIDDSEDYMAGESLFRWTSEGDKYYEDTLSLSFSGGVPTHVNHKEMDLLSLIKYMNDHVGSFGIGRFAGVEYGYPGAKVLELREAPAAFAIMSAYQYLEKESLAKEFLAKKQAVEQTWINEVIDGRWFGVLKEAVGSFIETAAKNVNGTVNISLGSGMIVNSVKEMDLMVER